MVDWSGFDLSSGSIIRAGVGIVGLALAFAIARHRPRPRPIALAALALAGLSFGAIVYNLLGIDAHNEALVEDPESLPPDVARMGMWVDAVGNAVAVVASVLGALALLPGLRARRSLVVVGCAGLALFVGTAILAALVEEGPGLAREWADTLAYAGAITSLAFLASCVAARACEGGAGAWAPGLLAVLAWVLAAETAGIVGYTVGGLAESSVGGWYVVPAPMLVLALVMLWRAARGPAGRAGWVSLLGLLGIALAAELAAVFYVDGDTVTESLEAGVTFLTYAVLSVLLLRAHPVGQRVGRVALTALVPLVLALLFATAEVVQNFTSSQAGLYAGGGVAFLSILVATPVQRRLEQGARRRARGDAAANYRRLVETAWTDGRLGANKRLLLAESRRQLGLDAEAAAGIDEDVARTHVQSAARKGVRATRGDKPLQPGRS